MKHAIVMLVAPDSQAFPSKPSWECDRIRTLTVFAEGNEARFVLDVENFFHAPESSDRLLYGNLNHCRVNGDSRTYVSLYVEPGQTELIGLYENIDITIYIDKPSDFADTYIIDNLYLNQEGPQPPAGTTYQVDPASFRYRIEKNNLVLLSGDFSCTLLQEGRSFHATGKFKCWKA